MASAERALAILRRLASAPRPAGGSAEREARAYCAGLLGAAGFAVREEPFEFSGLPGRWGTPIAGVALLGAQLAAARVGAEARGGAAIAVLAAVLALVALLGLLGARRGVTDLPAMRERSANLVATRVRDDGGEPAVWLVAHLDSKSQPVPIGARAAGIVVTALCVLGGLALGAAQVGGAEVAGWWRWLAAAAVVGAIPVIGTTVGARSPGALDDASGVATVLLAAEALPATVPVGVLLTSAEELGLAGARAWARGRRAGVAVNVDGVDDKGGLTAMYSGRRPTRLLEAFASGGRAADLDVRPRRLLPGILTDGVALADAGWEVATVSKGTPRTLARIHTPADHVGALAGTGIVEAARLVEATVRALT